MVATLVFSEAAERVFEEFMSREVPKIRKELQDSNAFHYSYCRFNGPDELSRRVLIVADAGSPIVRVCTEAAYELFEGDINYKVVRIGTVERQKVQTELVPLIEQAFARLVKWRPTHDNIWDNAY